MNEFKDRFNRETMQLEFEPMESHTIGMERAHNSFTGTTLVQVVNENKLDDIMKAYSGFTNTERIGKLLDMIPDAVSHKLHGWAIGAIMNSLDAMYYEGKRSAGAEVIEDYVYIEEIGRTYKLDMLRSIPE